MPDDSAIERSSASSISPLKMDGRLLSPKQSLALKILSAVFVALVSILAARSLAEKFFFDKFIYYKSTEYGYMMQGTKLETFGKRSQDVIALRQKNLQIRSNTFTVAAIGDSYVWGQGLRNEDRFAVLLERMLNRIRPTRVLSLALCGDNLLDDYVKYRQIAALLGKVDYFIFVIVDNDLLLNNDKRYGSASWVEKMGCSGPFVHAPLYDSYDKKKDAYTTALQQAYANTNGNICLLNQLAELLPKENAVYLPMDNPGSTYLQTYVQILRNHQLRVIDAKDFPQVYRQYRRYDHSRFQVSARELHPSALANRMYAEILFEEITTRVQQFH